MVVLLVTIAGKNLRRPNVLSLSRRVPLLSGSATRSVALNEARKRRAKLRHVVGCCEELASPFATRSTRRRHYSVRFVGFDIRHLGKDCFELATARALGSSHKVFFRH